MSSTVFRLLSRSVMFAFCLAIVPYSARAEDDKSASVRLPLNDYDRLIDASKLPPREPRLAPATYALGQANVAVTIDESNKQRFGAIRATVNVKVLEDQWTAVPILPAGVSVESATLQNGTPVEFIASSQGLLWSANKAGSYTLSLVYRADVAENAAGSSLSLPVPHASSIHLSGSLPAGSLDPVVIPSQGLKSTAEGNRVTIDTTVPSTTGVVIAWHTHSTQGFSVSRATYTGAYHDNALTFTGEIGVDLFDEKAITLPLLPTSATLSDIRVDKQTAPILLEDENGEEARFATRLQGKGSHTVTLDFTIPVDKDQSPLAASFAIPRVPVSKFVVSLPGKEELTVEPAGSVSRRQEKDQTVSTIFLPMTDSVTFQWTEAVPEEKKEEARVTVSVYHTASAEEGILSARALAVAEISRGKTNVLEFELPKGIQINRVSATGQTVADWRIAKGEGEARDTLQVYFDRAIDGEVQLEITYDTSLPARDKTQQIAIPLLRPKNIQRERGMVALLATKELTFTAVKDEDLTRVGENQLPPFIRQAIDKTVALSYKYSENLPSLTVALTKPERQQGRFDASVNTLISLGDVAIRGSASIDISVKSGNINTLQLELPAGANFLNLSAPSLRNQQLRTEGDKQIIDVDFTQDMEGDFRVEVAYERILPEKEQSTGVPTMLVRGAEIEQGRIAIEALSAVEVQAARAEHLSSVDPSELPQQLVLKTTNPILLAYKYAHVSPPYALDLNIARHKELEVQHAVIEQASYHTLVTKDGVSVTRAEYLVRNSREQFLRVTLPPESKVWQVFVNGKPEKPALAEQVTEGAKTGPTVLIRIINSVQGFPVDVLFETPTSPLSFAGRITSSLPVPNMVVTTSRWSVFLPSDLSYGRLWTNMTAVSSARNVLQYQMAESMQKGGAARESNAVEQPLPFSLPASGVEYSFERLYANQGDTDASWKLYYFGYSASIALQTVAIVALLVALRAALALVAGDKRRGAPQLVGAAVVLATILGWLHCDQRPALFVGLATVLLGVARIGFARIRRFLASRSLREPVAVSVDA